MCQLTPRSGAHIMWARAWQAPLRMRKGITVYLIKPHREIDDVLVDDIGWIEGGEDEHCEGGFAGGRQTPLPERLCFWACEGLRNDEGFATTATERILERLDGSRSRMVDVATRKVFDRDADAACEAHRMRQAGREKGGVGSD